VKRVYRVMKAHGLLLEHHTEAARNGGTMAVLSSTGLIPAGALTGSRSAATTARKSGSYSRSIAATARRSPGRRPLAASTAPISAI
jgi:hypothetical protein